MQICLAGGAISCPMCGKKQAVEKRKTPHSTRHTYASWALQSGIAPENLQKILGHKKFATTAEIYYHSNVDALVSTVLNASNRVSNRKQTDTDEN